MNQNIKFYDYSRNIYFTTKFIINNSIKNYEKILKKNNINLNIFSFKINFKIINIYEPIYKINDIIIIPNTFIKINSIPSYSLQNNILNYNTTNTYLNTINNDLNNNNTDLNNNNNDKIKLDEISNKYLTLLEKNPDLISFIIILKTDMIEYITLYLKKYRKKPIYNIIRNNQNEIIEMLETNKNFINLYIRTCNMNVLQNIISYSSNNIIISQIEEIFPDVPSENIEELIDIFSN